MPAADCADERMLAPSERMEESWALAPRARSTGVRIVEVRILAGSQSRMGKLCDVSENGGGVVRVPVVQLPCFD